MPFTGLSAGGFPGLVIPLYQLPATTTESDFITPDSDISTQWTKVGLGDDNWDMIDNESELDFDDTTYAWTTGVGFTDILRLSNLIVATGNIEQIDLHIRSSRSDSTADVDIRVDIVDNNGDSLVGFKNVNANESSFTFKTLTWSGLTLTPAAINAARLKYWRTGITGSIKVEISAVYLGITSGAAVASSDTMMWGTNF